MNILNRLQRGIKVLVCLIVTVGALNLGYMSADDTVVSNDLDIINNDAQTLSTTLSSASYASSMDANFVKFFITGSGNAASNWTSGVSPTSEAELTIEKLADYKGHLSYSTQTYNAGIASLEGLQYMTGVNGSVYFYNTSITELPDFEGRTYEGWTSFYIQNNQISDIRGLANAYFPLVTSFRFDSTYISDLTPMNTMMDNSLNHPDRVATSMGIRIGGRTWNDLSPLIGVDFTGITSMNIQGAQALKTLDGIDGLVFPDLTTLSLESNSSLETVAALANARFPLVTGLNLFSNSLNKSLDGITPESFPSLKSVVGTNWDNSKNSQLADITALENMTSLTTLYLYNGKIADWTPLENLTNLTNLRVFGQVAKVTGLYMSSGSSILVDSPAKKSDGSYLTYSNLDEFNASMDEFGVLTFPDSYAGQTVILELEEQTVHGLLGNTSVGATSSGSNINSASTIEMTLMPETIPGGYVSRTDSLNGGFSVDTTTFNYEGSVMTYHTSPADEYVLDTVTITGDSYKTYTPTVSGNSFTFMMPGENVNITATFKHTGVSKYTVSFNSPVNGNIYVADMVMNSGDTVIIQTYPNDNYALSTVTLNGNTNAYNYVKNGNSFTFTMPTSNVEVGVGFDDITSSKGGTVSAGSTSDGSFSVPSGYIVAGETVILNTVPSSNYYLSDVSIPGASNVVINGNVITFTMPSSDVIITPIFSALKGGYVVKDVDYTINKGDFALPSGFIQAGETVTVVTNPETGYSLNWVEAMCEGISVTTTRLGNSFSFIMPEGNVSLDAGFAFGESDVVTYFVTPVPSENGSYNAPAAVAEPGATVNVSNITPVAGYAIEGVYVNGAAINVIGNLATFTMPSENVVIEVKFISTAEVVYNVTTTTIDGVSVVVDPMAAKPGTELTINATNVPNGKKVTGFMIYCNGSVITVSATDNSATTTMLTGDMTISPIVADVQTAFEVKASPLDALLATFEFKDGISTGEVGETVKFKVTPKDPGQKVGYVKYANNSTGYISESLTVDSEGYYSIVMDGSDVTVYANFISSSFTITSASTVEDKDTNNGYLVVTTPNVSYGEEYVVNAYPNPGYRLKEIIKNATAEAGISLASTPDVVVTNSSVYKGVLTEAKNLSLTGIFEIETYNVTQGTTVNGTIDTITNGTNVNYNAVVTIDVTPATGYVLDKLYYEVDGNQIDIPLSTATQGKFYMPNTDVEVKATFKSVVFTITVADGLVGGTLSTDVVQATEGTEVTITSVANGDYKLEQLVVVNKDNGDVIAVVDNKFLMPDAGVLVSGSFLLEGNSISISSNAGGTPSINKYVALMDELVEITPNPLPGYEVENITATVGGNVINLGLNTSYKVLGQGDVALYVTFTQVGYAIEVESNEGGEVVVADSAKYGDLVNVTITPKLGYQVASVDVDGNTSSAVFGSNDTFTMINEDVVITVVFEKIKYSVMGTPGLSNVDITIKGSAGGATISTAEYLQEVFATVEAHSGYEVLGTYYVEEGVVGVMKPFDSSFIMPASNVYVTATIDSKNYEIDLDQTQGNWIGIKNNDTNTSKAGYMVEVEVVAELDPTLVLTGLTVEDLTNGGTQTITGTIFAMPSGDVKITPIFGELTYSVSVDTNIVGGSIALAGGVSAAKPGETLNLLVTPAEGYSFVGLSIYELGGVPSTYDETGLRTISMINNNAIVTAKFAVNNYGIEVRPSEDCIDGTFNVTTNPDGMVPYGTLVNVAVDTNTEAKLEKVELVKVDGQGEEIANGRTTLTAPYSFNMPGSKVVIEYTYATAGFQINTFVKSDEGATGTITTEPNGFADGGEQVKVIIKPDGSNTIASYTVKGIDGTSIEVNDLNISNGILYFDMPEQDVNIEVTFTAKAYNIKVADVAVVGGEVKAYSDEGLTQEITVAKEGQKFWIEATTNSGYHLQSLSVIPDNLSVAMMSNSIVTSHTMTASDVTITPIWIAKNTYVSINPTVGGTVTVPTTYNTPGTTVSLNVTADTGYELEEITLSTGGSLAGGEITLNNGKYEFVMPNSSVTVTTTFTALTYGLTLNSTGGTSTVEFAGSITEAKFGEVVSLDVALSNGEVVESMTITYDDGTGSKTVNVRNNAFVMPAAEVTVDVTFSGAVYPISVATIVGGSMKVYLTSDLTTEITEAQFGDELTVVVTPNSGYTLETISYLNNLSSNLTNLTLEADGLSATYTMEASSVLLYAKLTQSSKLSVGIDASQDSTNGSVNLSNRTAAEGDTITVNAYPNTGYEVTAVNFFDASGTSYDESTYSNGTFTMPSHNVTVAVVFSAIEYTITADAVTYTDSTDATAVTYGQSVSFTPNTVAGQAVSSVEITTDSSNRFIVPTIESGVYTFEMPFESVTITVNYTSANVTGTTSYDASQGMVMLSKTTVMAGTDVTVHTFAKSGYQLESITIVSDAGSTVLENLNDFNNTFTAPSSDYTVVVVFGVKTYALTSATTVMPNGTLEFNIEGNKVELADVQEGATVQVVVTPSEGYQFNYYTENNTPTSGDFVDESFAGNIGKTGESTFNYVMPGFDVELYAYFSLAPDYSVSTPEVQNGVLSVSVVGTSEKEELMITAEPEEGYAVATAAIIELDSGSRTAIEFNNDNVAVISKPQTDVELDVTFALVASTDAEDEFVTDLESSTGGDLAATDTESNNSDVTLDNSDDSSASTNTETTTPTTSTGTSTNTTATGVLTGDASMGVAGLAVVLGLAGIAGFLTRRKK